MHSYKNLSHLLNFNGFILLRLVQLCEYYASRPSTLRFTKYIAHQNLYYLTPWGGGGGGVKLEEEQKGQLIERLTGSKWSWESGF